MMMTRILYALCLAMILGLTLPEVAAATWHAAKAPLMTRWSKLVSPTNALTEYPRPQMVRKLWLNLNGLWNLDIVKDKSGTVATSHQILVPFPVESALSGVMNTADRLRYRRSFTVPESWAGKRVLLHFGAVDWETKVTVNGQPIGEHRGGYDGFSFDITDHLTAGGAQDLVVDVYDPTDGGDQPRGKQVNNPHGIFYTPCTGIWQTVWLEPVPAQSIDHLVITPDVEGGCLRLKVQSPKADGYTVRAVAIDGARMAGQADGKPGKELSIPIPNAKLWSPSSPFLYRLNVSLLKDGKAVDSVKSYFGMRSIDIRKVAGIPRMMLNGKPVFQVGPLDQGFWPDGIYTAPTDAALKYDITIAKKLGFNMIRKHVKVEPERWYYWCDKLGMLVWQDMPSGDNKTEEGRRQFELELQRLVKGRRNSPSIIVWVPFNEGWGQYDTERIAPWVKSLDPSRLVNSASGWTDKGVGDMYDTHSYPAPISPAPVWPRVAVVGEFGGLGLKVPGHMWTEEAWGYQSFNNSLAVTRKYEQLYRKVWALKDDPGICAVVYTQTTDVETEANGLLTYDREIMKLDATRVTAANTGHLPPLDVETVIVPTSETEPYSWHYTLDKPSEDWAASGFDDSGWLVGPAGFGAPAGTGIRTPWTTSDIWMRRNVDIAKGIKGIVAVRIRHDDDARIFINGVEAAAVPGATAGYEDVDISPAARAGIKAGRNVIAIHCRQTGGDQFIDAGIVALTPGR